MNTWLLIIAFSLFTFKANIDRYVFIVILLCLRIILILFCSFFLLSLSCLVISWLSLGLYLKALFFSCICIYNKFLVCDYHKVYIYQSIYMWLSCWSLKFECILITLHFYNPQPHLTFLTPYFTFLCFVYPLTIYCGNKWFYYFRLLTFSLVL